MVFVLGYEGYITYEILRPGAIRVAAVLGKATLETRHWEATTTDNTAGQLIDNFGE